MRPLLITVFDSATGGSTDHTFATSPVRIGRNPLNDLPLQFPFVSGWHAVVRFDETAAKFFDLGSTNGTLLDGKRVSAGHPVTIEGVLSVTIGGIELRFQRGQQVAAAPNAAGGGHTTPSPGQQPPLIGQGQLPHGAPGAQPGSGTVQPASPRGLDPPASAAGTIDVSHPVAPQQPADGTRQVHVAEVHAAVQQLRPLFVTYRKAHEAFAKAREDSLGRMQGPLRDVGRAIMDREFRSPEGGSPLPPQSPSAPAVGPSDALGRLAEALRPGEPPPASPHEAEQFLALLAQVLQASAKAFVELQKGQEQFGQEMGVRTIKEFTPLHAVGTSEGVLKYLLDFRDGGPQRTHELVGVYADLMIHQVALINGVMEGARAMLARLAPAEIERGVTASWPTRAAAIWKQYMQRYEALTEEDRKITEAVFGPEFARAYAEVGGEGGPS